MLLNKNWKMTFQGRTLPCKSFPVSIYQTLISNGKADSPYYGEGLFSLPRPDQSECEFFCDFVPEIDLFGKDKIYLRFHGIDTLGEIFLNDRPLFKTDNMFVCYEYEVQSLLKKGINRLSVKIKSPPGFTEESGGVYSPDSATEPFTCQNIRRYHGGFGSHYESGLIDMGIWRDVELIGKSLCEIKNISFKQAFNEDLSRLSLTVIPEFKLLGVKPLDLLIEISLSDGRRLISKKPLHQSEAISFQIENPPLWNVRGMGKQNLQEVALTVFDGENAVDVYKEKIGFLSLEIKSEDKNGSLRFILNKKEIFVMAANIFPTDRILPFASSERENNILERCKEFGFNCVRICGKGVYPDDRFLNKCDELGIMVWQDFMFSACAYKLTGSFMASVKRELSDNIIRMRNHPSLALWCGGDNLKNLPEASEAKSDNERLFEKIIPQLLKELDPDAFYIPYSSILKTHIKEYGSYYKDLPYKISNSEHLSEIASPLFSQTRTASLPSIKTITTFAKGRELNLSSPVMRAHQPYIFGNEKMLFDIASLCRCPKSFEETIYASQFVQAELMRMNIESIRRRRIEYMINFDCRFNDSLPVISSSMLDFFGRPKAICYAAKRFCSPVLISCAEEKPEAVKIYITNDSHEAIKGKLWWQLRRNDGETIKSGSSDFEASALSSGVIASLNLGRELKDIKNRRSCFLEFEARKDNKTILEGCEIFTAPRSFNFLPPDFSLNISETPSSFVLILKSKSFAKGVILDLKDADCVFDDNFFDICGKKKIEIKKETLTRALSIDALRKRLTVESCYDLYQSVFETM